MLIFSLLGIAFICGLMSRACVAQPPAELFSGGARQVASWEYEAAQRGQIDLGMKALGEAWALKPQFSTAFLHLRVPFSSQVIVKPENADPVTVRSRGGFRHLQLTGLPARDSVATVEVQMSNEYCLEEDCEVKGAATCTSCTKQIVIWPGRRHYLQFTKDDFKAARPEVRDCNLVIVHAEEASDELPAPKNASPKAEEPLPSTSADYQFKVDFAVVAELTLTQDAARNAKNARDQIKTTLRSAVIRVEPGLLEKHRRWAINETFRMDMHLHAYGDDVNNESFLALGPMTVTLVADPEEDIAERTVSLQGDVEEGDWDELDSREGNDFFAELGTLLSDDDGGAIDFYVSISRIHQVREAEGEPQQIILQRYRVKTPARLLTLTVEK